MVGVGRNQGVMDGWKEPHRNMRMVGGGRNRVGSWDDWKEPHRNMGWLEGTPQG